MSEHEASGAALPLASRRVAFAERLVSMSRSEAEALVRRHGGVPIRAVSPRTDLLVVGEEGWPLEPDGRPSRKLSLAIRLRREGHPIEILPETEWLAQLGLVDRQHEVRRMYTAATLARVLGIGREVVDGWIRRGLIRPVRKVCRLSYFDFREAAGAKRLAELIAAGIPRRVIEEGLKALRGWLPHVERPLSQLALLADDGKLMVRRGGHVVEASGQRRFDFGQTGDAEEPEPDQAPSDSPRNAVEWLALGQQQEEEGHLQESADAFRNALLLQGPDAAATFHLGHVLYRMGQREAARERFHQAVEIDADYVEAWNNLGSVLSELEQPEAAIDAFRCALAVHSDYADAHYNLADSLEEIGQYAEAALHWRAYLQFDTRSSWAEEARQRLRRLDSPADRPHG